jgi:hypothetical protein
MISSLEEFGKQYEKKLSSLDLQTVQSLKIGYEGLKVFGDNQHIQTIVDDAILVLLPVLFNFNIIDTFDLENVSKLSLFEFKKIEKDNAHGQFLAKMNGILGHYDISFDILERELKKLEIFFSHVPTAQLLGIIQKIFATMKKDLTSIKNQFQTQISPKSIDLYTAWKSSLLFVECYSQKSVSIHHLVIDHILRAIDFYLGMLRFHSEFSFLKIRLIGIKGMVKHNSLSGVVQSLCQLVPLIDIYLSKGGLNLNWTGEAITRFKTDIRTMFSSEVCSFDQRENFSSNFE